MLALIDQVIQKRLNGDGYEQYSVQQRQFFGTKLKDLFAIRTDLQNRIAGESGQIFTLGRGFKD